MLYSYTRFQQTSRTNLQPAIGVLKTLLRSQWPAFFALVSSALLFIAPGTLRILFPLFALLTALYLYFTSTRQYIAFTWWLYFLSPLLRRLVDYRTEYTDPSTILLAPLLATLVSACSLPYLKRRDPWLLAFFGTFLVVVYTALITMSHDGVAVSSALRELLSWTAPILWGLFLYGKWRESPAVRETLESTFAWGMIVLGGYALFQVLTAPAWDASWMVNSEMNSLGNPEPMQFRAFSTVNSQQPLALICVLGLILVFSSRGFWCKLSAIPGIIGLALSMSRGGWIACLFAVLCYVALDRSRRGLLTVVTAIAIVGGLIGAVYSSPFGQQLSTRVQTFSNAASDESAEARLNGYEEWLHHSAHDPFGAGFGAISAYETQQDDDSIGAHDSMPLELLLTSGWFGLIAFSAALAGVTWLLISRGLAGHVTAVAAPAAVLVGLDVQSPLNSMTGGAQGLILWTCIGCGLASLKYAAQTEGVPVSVSATLSRRTLRAHLTRIKRSRRYR